MTAGIENLGGVKLDLLGTLCLTWILVFLCLCKGRLPSQQKINPEISKQLSSQGEPVYTIFNLSWCVKYCQAYLT